MEKYVKLHFKFMAQSIKTLLEYKVDFIIGFLGFLLTQTLGLVLISTIFKSVPEINGWDYNQVVFIYAFSQIPRGLDHLLTDNLWVLSRRIIIYGEFDKYLLKPINPLFYLLAEKYQTDAFGELIIGSALMVYAGVKINMHVRLTSILVMVILAVAGAIIYSSIKLICASLSFWMKNSFNVLSMIYSVSDYAKYPISIYPKIIRSIITYILPFAFTAYYPVSYLFDKEKMYFASFATVIFSVIFAIISYSVWNVGLRKYESTGS